MLRQQQQQEELRFPPISKTHRFKLLKDVTQQPYRIGMVQYYPGDAKSILQTESSTDEEDVRTPDPGAEVVEKNRQDRMQRMAASTKEELDKVLKRVDHTMNNYEYSVQSSLIQQGMRREDLTSVEHVADVQELEYLLSDSLAKQRYKQRLMVFIVGQAEQAKEKSQLLQQLGQFFSEQKHNFSGREFNDIDDSGDVEDEIEIALKSFDVKECYANVKALGNRLNELNEEIIQFLVQNTGTKQTKVMVERGKRKLAQVTKEAKEQLAELNTKLDLANAEMLGKDAKIQSLEKDIEGVRAELKTTQDILKKTQEDLKRREAEAKYFKRKATEFDEVINRYRSQFGDIPGLTFTGLSEVEDGDETNRLSLDTIDELESKQDKDSQSSQTAREQGASTAAPATTTEVTAGPGATARSTAAGAPTVTQPPAEKGTKKTRSRDKSKRGGARSKKETAETSGEEDPAEIYRRSQQLLEQLLGDKNENTPDLNQLFKATRGVDLNNVSMDNLPTAFTNLRKFAIARVKDLLKDLETKETTNKETVQVLKQEFIEHKTKYEKERLMYFLSLDPDDNSLQEEQNALAEKADNAHKLQMQAQKTAEEALGHLELFMVEQEKLDQQDVARQTELVHRHSVVVNNVTGVNITPPAPPDPVEPVTNDHLSPPSKRSSPPKSQWQRLSSVGNTPPRTLSTEEPKSSMYETAQAVKRMSSTLRKTPTPKNRTDSIEQKTPPGFTSQKSTLDQSGRERATSASRRLSMAVNEDGNILATAITPRGFERTPSMHSRPLTRSNSMNPATKEQEKSSSGERSHFNSGPQSRRVSIGMNRSPVRAEDLERLLTKVVNDEVEALEDWRRTSMKSRTSLREKYMSLLEEKKHQLDDLKQQADATLSRPTTSHRERRALDSLENSAGLVRQTSIVSPLDTSNALDMTRQKENRPAVVTHDQEQQTSLPPSPAPTPQKEKSILSPPQVIQIDHFKVPFFHLYETIYKFRHSITNLLEQNKFRSLAERLDMIQQLSSIGPNGTNDYVENSERVLKDTVKVLQTCMTTLMSSLHEHENKQKVAPPPTVESPKPLPPPTNKDQEYQATLQQKDSLIDELNTKYEQVTQSLEETKKKHGEETSHTEKIISEQQKLIHNLQHELMRVQKRLSKVEMQGVVQPSIMFTHLDAQRNEQVLQQAVDKGKIPETAVNELTQSMEEYVRLPTQQFGNLVKRYIQYRKATQLEDRIQSETFDNETKSVMEKMGEYYQRRSGQISERISSIRQHRATLARSLTEKFDHLENESSLFLIRPIYSYQGRSAAQSYMTNEKRRQEALLKGSQKKKKHPESRQSGSTPGHQTSGDSRQLATVSSSTSTSDDEERLFQIEKTFTFPRPTPASQQSIQNMDTATTTTANNAQLDSKPKQAGLTDMTRLEEFDIQRTLLPVSHASVPLSGAAGSSNDQESSVPSLNLRSYIPLTRPGVGGAIPLTKFTDESQTVSREGLSALSAASRVTNPRTPFNSTIGDLRRTSPPLPPIKRSLNSSAATPLHENDGDEFVPSVSTNEFAHTEATGKEEPPSEK